MCRPLENRKAFYAFLDTLEEHDWVVYAKNLSAGPEHVQHYLARYTHRVAISNHRLVDVTDTNVTFRWKDYAHHSKRGTMTLSHQEFLRQFLQHVLPRGSRAFDISASSPIAGVAHGCRSALRHALSNPLNLPSTMVLVLIAPPESLLCEESSGEIGIQNP